MRTVSPSLARLVVRHVAKHLGHEAQHRQVERSVGLFGRDRSRPIRTWEEAEEAACAWSRALGCPDASLTTSGADGGIDVLSKTMAAQVKFYAQPVGRPALQALYGAATATGRQSWFFATSGFTEQARVWGRTNGMVLFLLDPTDAGLTGITPNAEKMLQDLMHKVPASSMSRAELSVHMGRREAELSRLRGRVKEAESKCRELLATGYVPDADVHSIMTDLATAVTEDNGGDIALPLTQQSPHPEKIGECTKLRRQIATLIHPDLPGPADLGVRTELMALVNVYMQDRDVEALREIQRDIVKDPSCEEAMCNLLKRQIDAVEAEISIIQRSRLGQMLSQIEMILRDALDLGQIRQGFQTEPSPEAPKATQP